MSWRSLRIPLLCLCLIVVAVYLQTLGFSYIQLDDPKHIFENPAMLAPSFAQWLEFWRKPFFNMYIPLVYSLWTAASLVTLSPSWFHFLNVATHAANSVLVFLICLRLLERRSAKNFPKSSIPMAALMGAILFAIHPLQVESVAWISGMKDLLFSLWGLLAIFFYLEYREHEEKRSYLLASLFFLLSLLSKPTAIVIPLILVVLDHFWFERKIPLKRLGPWFILSLAFAWMAKTIQQDASVQDISALGLRPFIVGDSLLLYFSKLLLPFRLSLDYGHSPHWVSDRSLFEKAIFLTPYLFLYWLYSKRRRAKEFFVSALIFLISVSPVLGVVAFQHQLFSTPCDHYVYLGFLGVALFASFGFTKLTALRTEFAARNLFAVPLVTLALLSYLQTSLWKSDKAIFLHSLSVNPESFLLHNNLAFALYQQNDFQGAVDHFRKVVSLRPESPDLHVNFGSALIRTGRWQDGMDEFRAAINLEPNHFNANLDLGRALLLRGQPKAAIPYLRRALDLAPERRDIRLLLEAAEQPPAKKIPSHV